jgi:hypothetical protein
VNQTSPSILDLKDSGLLKNHFKFYFEEILFVKSGFFLLPQLMADRLLFALFAKIFFNLSKINRVKKMVIKPTRKGFLKSNDEIQTFGNNFGGKWRFDFRVCLN